MLRRGAGRSRSRTCSPRNSLRCAPPFPPVLTGLASSLPPVLTGHAAEFPAVRRPQPGLHPLRPLRPVACPVARARLGLRLLRPPFGRSSAIWPQLCAKMKSKMQVVGVVNSVCPAEHSHPGAHNYQVAPAAPPRSTPAGPPREQERPRAGVRAESVRAATPRCARGRRRTCCTGRTASRSRCGGSSSACPSPDPPPPPRTKWTRRVPHPVLIGPDCGAGLSPASSRTTSRRFPPVQILADSSNATWGRPSPRTPVRSCKKQSLTMT